MPLAPSSANEPLDKLALELATRAVVCRHTKRADLSSMLGSGADWLKEQGSNAVDWAQNSPTVNGVVDWAKQNPTLASTAGGAALGGLYGLGSSFSDPDPRRRRPFGSAMTGALAGAGVGGGLGLLGNFLQNGTTPPPGPRVTPEMRDQALKSQEISLNPLHYLKQYYDAHPVLGTLGAADAVSHGIGTAAERAMPGSGLNVHNLAAGVRNMGEGAGGSKDLAEFIRTQGKEVQQQLLSSSLGMNPGDPLVHGGKTLGTVQELRNIMHAGTGDVRMGGLKDTHNLVGNLWNKAQNAVTGPSRSALGVPPRSFQPGTVATGRDALGNSAGWGSSLMQNLNERGGSAGPGWKSTALKKLGPRALLYGGLPVMQHWMRDYRDSNDTTQQLRELLQQGGGQ